MHPMLTVLYLDAQRADRRQSARTRHSEGAHLRFARRTRRDR